MYLLPKVVNKNEYIQVFVGNSFTYFDNMSALFDLFSEVSGGCGHCNGHVYQCGLV